jgi:small subunit ribosomal protein S9
VWVVPSQAARTLADVKEGEEAAPVSAPTSEILVNHLPLPSHFAKVADREAVLRPLRVTGLLGAYNVFASVRGGGSTGQSGAVAHALAQAVTLLRPDAHDALFNDGLLARDPRVVERKKTNRPKARKGVSLCSHGGTLLTITVHLGQALSWVSYYYHSSMHHSVLAGRWAGRCRRRASLEW